MKNSGICLYEPTAGPSPLLSDGLQAESIHVPSHFQSGCSSVFSSHDGTGLGCVLWVHFEQHSATDGGSDADKLPPAPLRCHLTEILTTQHTEAEICVCSVRDSVLQLLRRAVRRQPWGTQAPADPRRGLGSGDRALGHRPLSWQRLTVSSLQTSSPGACGHTSTPDRSAWQYRTWLADQGASPPVCVLCSSSRGHLCTRGAVCAAAAGPGVICRGRVSQGSVCSHIRGSLALQLKAWPMNRALCWWHNQWAATVIPPAWTSQEQPRRMGAVSSPSKQSESTAFCWSGEFQKIQRLFGLQITCQAEPIMGLSFFYQKAPYLPC